MKTVIDSQTGEVLFTTVIEDYQGDNQLVIDSVPTGNYYNFETREFYDKE